MVRLARAEDREALRDLWQVCFDDAPAFTDWFFRERFVPEYSAVCERGGMIAAAMHGYPLCVRVRDTVVPGAVIAGVSTHPEHRGQGHMHRMMRFFLQEMRERGIVVTPHRPARLQTFFSLGHYPVSDRRLAGRGAGPCTFAPDGEDSALCDAPQEELFSCYTRCMLRYSGMIARSRADYALKCADYASDGARCLLLREDGRAAAYCIYFPRQDALEGEECVAGDALSYARLCRAMAALAAPQRALSMKLPDDAGEIEGFTSASEPYSVMGLCDAGALLEALGLDLPCIEVTDEVVPQNTGLYGAGHAPALRLAAGHLLQWALGYRSMADIAAAGEAEVFDADAVGRCDAAGVRPCFIVDEY